MPRNHFPNLLCLGDGLPFASRLAEALFVQRPDTCLGREEIEHLAPHLMMYRAPAGSVILSESDPGDFMLFIVSGLVQVVKDDKDGRRKEIGVLGAGHSIGDMSLLDCKPRSASCIAADDTVFAVLDRDSLGRLIDADPRTGAVLLLDLGQNLSQRLRDTDQRLVDLLDF